MGQQCAQSNRASDYRVIPEKPAWMTGLLSYPPLNPRQRDWRQWGRSPTFDCRMAHVATAVAEDCQVRVHLGLMSAKGLECVRSELVSNNLTY